MTIMLHTRSGCDACFAPATFQSDHGDWYCDSCAGTVTRFEIPSALSSPDANASLSNPTPGPASGATLSVSDGFALSSLPSGESEPLVTLAFAPSESSSCGGHESRVAAVSRENRSTKVRETAILLVAPSVSASPQCEAAAGIASGPQDSIPNPVPWASLPPAQVNCALVTNMSAGAPFSSFDAEISAAIDSLLSQWTGAGIIPPSLRDAP